MSIQNFIISKNQSAHEALEVINKSALPKVSLFVKEESQKIIGTLTEGDIRRGLLAGKSLEQSVTDFMHSDFRYFEENKNNFNFFKECKALKIRFIPVLNSEKKLVEICDIESLHSYIPATAILMAGGLGERLKPLTDKTPKPLLKVGDKAIIDYNIDNLEKNGVKHFYVALRYKAKEIEEHLNKKIISPSYINYVHEQEPRGTAGALSELKNIYTDCVLLMNSELCTKVYFSAL